MPAVTTVPFTGDQDTDGLLSGVRWGVSRLTFSFPTSASFYAAGYGSGEPLNGFEALNIAQKASVRLALGMYASVANITFLEIAETASAHADLRFAESDEPSTAWAYYPATQSYGGDSWYNNSSNTYDTPVRGNYAFLTFIHEIGHALGLKHGHEDAAMSPAHDSMEYSVMTYRSYVGQPVDGGYTNGSWSYAQTPMMYDIAALQHMYGANYATNSGDSTYTWNPATGEFSIDGVGRGAPIGNRVFMTLWDGGGTDTYDFSSYSSGVAADLRPGMWSTTAPGQLAYLGDGNFAAGNIANALMFHGDARSLIENVSGGSGDDVLTGNDIANLIIGNIGRDTLSGLGGNDILFGGAGNDALSGGAGFDTSRYSSAKSAYLVGRAGAVVSVSGSEGVDALSGVERLQFSDVLVKPSGYLPVTDFNGDGGSDVLWKHSDGSVTLSTLDGLTASASRSFGFAGWRVLDSHADFNADGRSDLLWQHSSGEVSVWTMNGVNDSASRNYTLGTATLLDDHSDFNADGKTDLVWRNPDGSVALWTMDGIDVSGTRTYAAVSGATLSDSHGDFNGDGKNDLAWKHANGALTLWLMDGVDTIGSRTVGPYAGWKSIDTRSDFNGDGKTDLLWQYNGGEVSVWTMDGTTDTASRNYPAAPGRTLYDSHSDFNGDGKSDLLWHEANGGVTVWTMNGVNRIASSTFGPYLKWDIVKSDADLNGDGKTDLIWRHTSGEISVWTMDGVASAGSRNYAASADSTVLRIDDVLTGQTDFNGDDKADLAWQNANGSMSVWLMNGVSVTESLLLSATASSDLVFV